jgi:type I restriction enzyme S subunit
MADEWASASLDDLTETPITYGVVKPGEEDTSGVLFIRGGDVADGQIRVDALRTITRAVSDQYTRTLLRGGELVVSLVGNPGQVAIVPHSLAGANIARQVGLVRLSNRADTRFVKYFLLSRQGQLALGAHSLGSVQQVINLRDLKTVKVPQPPLREQQAIACILGALDDKIELNRRRNRTLEALARAIFQSWFVDFDPVKAKAAGRTPPGLSPALAALFPDSFTDSPLGPIPTGWRVGSVGDVAGLLGGYAFKSKEWIDQGVPVVKIGSVKPGMVDLDQVSYVSHDIAALAARYRLDVGDLLIGMTGYVGEVGLVPPTDELPLLNQRVGKFVLETKGTPGLGFVYCSTRRPEFKSSVETKSHGTAQANVSAQGILSVPIVVPTKVVRDRFDNTCAPFFEKLLANHKESRTLAALRDALLPKLISGELRVPDAERIVGRAV